MQKAQLDKILGALGIHHTRMSGEQLRCACPLVNTRHNTGDTTRPDLSVSTGPGMSLIKCFGCGIGGTLKTLIRATMNDAVIDVTTAHDLLALCDWADTDTDIDSAEDVEFVQPSLDPAVLNLLSEWHPYFAHRRFSCREALEWRLGYDPHMKAVLLPCATRDGHVPYVQARFIEEKDFRWLPTGIRKQHNAGTHLFTGKERIIAVTEGIFDAMRVRRALRKLGWLPGNGGEWGVVALFGSQPNPYQREHLFSLLPRDGELVLCMDNDPAGEKCAELLDQEGQNYVRAITRLPFPSVENEAAHSFKDPDELGSKRLMELLPQRESLLSIKVKRTLRIGDLVRLN